MIYYLIIFFLSFYNFCTPFLKSIEHKIIEGQF